MELLKIEFSKVKKSSILSLAISIAVLSVIIALNVVKNLGNIVEAKYVYLELLNFSAISYLVMFLPLLCIYTACNITKIENENSGWKQLMLLPIKKSSVYMAKCKLMMTTLAISITSYIISILLGAMYLNKRFYFSYELLVYGVEIFITTLPIIILLFIIGRRFVSIVPVISVGLGMLITTIFIVQSKFWIYAPWTYSMALIGGGLGYGEKVLAVFISISLSLLMFIIDYISFKNEDVKEK